MSRLLSAALSFLCLCRLPRVTDLIPSSMSAKHPTVVLVPGAWTAPIAYHKLVSALEAKSFNIHVPALPTNNGDRPPNSSFDGDIQAVRQVVQRLAYEGKEVIMLMHSYGGIAGTSALEGLTRKDFQSKGLPGGVVHLIYVAAFMLGLEQNIRTVVQAVNLTGRNSLVQFANDGAWFPVDPVQLLYQDLTPEDQEEQTKLLKWGNSVILTGNTIYEAWKDVPTLYVRSTEDRWLPPEFQDFCLKNAENAGVSVSVSALQSGHSPYVKFAEEIAEMTLQVSAAGNCR
ncbi:Alpha/beta hydrolase fold-1 [Xylaria longipes]|nr:Alpha/beta hydrolase fold-1 [Xylaria longipes]